MMYLRKKKSSFILIEVLVAMTLLFIVGFAYIEIQKGLADKMRATIKKSKQERQAQQALVRLIEKLWQNVIPWEVIEQQKSYRLVLDPAIWEVEYSFTNVKHEEEPLPTNSVDVEVTFELYKNGEKVLQTNDLPFKSGPYRFCMTKKVGNDATAE